MQDEDRDRDKDKRLKYVELPRVFHDKASKIDIDCKISMRKCELLAKHLAKQKPKTAQEFEQKAYIEEFVTATATANEDMISLLRYMHGFLTEVMADATHLIEGAILRDKLKDQGDTILIQIEESRSIMAIQKDREKMYKAKIAEYERNNSQQNQGNP